MHTDLSNMCPSLASFLYKSHLHTTDFDIFVLYRTWQSITPMAASHSILLVKLKIKKFNWCVNNIYMLYTVFMLLIKKYAAGDFLEQLYIFELEDSAISESACL